MFFFNFLANLLLHLKLLIFTLLEELKILVRYRRRAYLKSHFLLKILYFFHNPYRISFKKTGVVYGETPVTTWDTIAKECRLLSHDIVYDIGCGRGEGVFWLSQVLNCKAVGVDLVPLFIRRAQQIKRWSPALKANFLEGDFLTVDLTPATAIYFYGSAYEEETILAFLENLKKTSPGTKIITISFPLTDYCFEPLFELKKCFPVTFPWGTTDAYLHQRIG